MYCHCFQNTIIQIHKILYIYQFRSVFQYTPPFKLGTNTDSAPLCVLLYFMHLFFNISIVKIFYCMSHKFKSTGSDG